MKEIAGKNPAGVEELDVLVKNQTREIPFSVVRNKGYLFIKRSFDIIVSLSIGIAGFIPMLLIAVLIKLESPGPVLFKQKRMGKGGVPFTIYKFRSMHMHAPSDMPTNDLKNLDMLATKFGNFMRKTSLDELPQIINVLKGDMSLVGYRPVCLTEEKLNQMRMDYGVFKARPGITGYAQVLGRDRVSKEEKARLDAYYVSHRSICMDLWCLFRTVFVVATQEGAK